MDEHLPRQQRPDARRLPAAIRRRGHGGADVWIPTGVWWCSRFVGRPGRAGRFRAPSFTPGETLADAVDRSLREKANVRGLHPRQLHVFDDPTARSIAVGCCLSPTSTWCGPNGWRRASARPPGSCPSPPRGGCPTTTPTSSSSPSTIFVPATTGQPDPDGLLGERFTLRDLRFAHEAVAGHPLQRDSFRRTMEPQLVATGTTSSGGRGRPAELFKRRDAAAAGSL